MPTLDCLGDLVAEQLEHKPFHNFDMLLRCARTGENSNTNDSSSNGGFGAGVAVNDPNLNFAEKLRRVGFKVRCVAAQTRLAAERDGHDAGAADHVALVVTASGRDYWVDVGNGRPYLKPVAVPPPGEVTSPETSHPELSYRLAHSPDGKVTVEHSHRRRSQWLANYSWQAGGAGDGDGDAKAVLQRHLASGASAFGPFLRGLRLSKWSAVGGVSVRDATLHVVGEGTREAGSPLELHAFVYGHFGSACARKLLCALGVLHDNFGRGAEVAQGLHSLLRTNTRGVLLVTGAAGFIASHILCGMEAEWARFRRVILVDHCRDVEGRFMDTKQELLADARRSAESCGVVVDVFFTLAEAEPLLRDVRSDVSCALLLAALPNVRVCNDAPQRCEEHNIGLMRRVLAVLPKTCGVIFTSSSTVYGKSPRPWHEDAEPAPEGCYAESKHECEKLLRSFGFVSVCVLRLFSVFGARGRGDMFPALMMRAIRGGDVFEYFSPSEPQKERDFTYVGDIAPFVRRLLSTELLAQGIRGFEVVNLGNGQPVSLAKVQSIIESIAGCPARTYMHARAGDDIRGNVDATEASVDKATRLGFVRTPNALEKGLREQWEQMDKEHPRETTGTVSVSRARSVPDIASDIERIAVEKGCDWWNDVRLVDADSGFEANVPLRHALRALPRAARHGVEALMGCESGCDEVVPAGASALNEVFLAAVRGGENALDVAALQKGFVPQEGLRRMRAFLAPVIVVIATRAGREQSGASGQEVLVDRALRSVALQSARVTETVVVADGGVDDEALRGVVREACSNTTVLENRRTIGMSGTGSWNTAIDYTHDKYGDGAWVAMLDDDDEWKSEHVERNLRAGWGRTHPDRVQMCVSGLVRITGEKHQEQPPPVHFPPVEELLVTNPGIQGSNLFVRCGLLVLAGGFDEALPSATDRDLCIRLHDVFGGNGDAYACAEGQCTAWHYADDNRPRVSTRGSDAKRNGLQRFYYKHRPRMTPELEEKFFRRGRELFDCVVAMLCAPWVAAPSTPRTCILPTAAQGQPGVSLSATAAEALQKLLQNPPETGTPAARKKVVIGVVTSSAPRCEGLLHDLHAYAAQHPTRLVLEVLVLHTGTDDDRRALDIVTGACGGLSVDVRDVTSPAAQAVVAVTWPGGSKPDECPIAVTRTVLQYLLYYKAEEEADAVVVLDDDKRLPARWGLHHALAECEAGHERGSSESGTILIGRDVKTAPNTVLLSMRTQLVDALSSLRLQQRGLSPVPDFASIDANTWDQYYDLSSTRWDHLEMPRYVAACGSADNVAARVLAGDPLCRDAIPGEHEVGEETTQRGGCMLVPRQRFKALLTPQLVPRVCLGGSWQALRRSDSVWAKYQSLVRGVPCRVSRHLTVLHDNRVDLDVQRKLMSEADDECVRHACAKSRRDVLLETLGSLVGSIIDGSVADTAGLVSADEIRKKARARFGRLRRHFMRTGELMKQLRTFGSGPHVDALGLTLDPPLCELEVFAPAEAFVERLCKMCGEKLPWAELLRRAAGDGCSWDSMPRLHAMTVVGAGNEGVVLCDGDQAVKVFDAREQEDLPPWAALLPQLSEVCGGPVDVERCGSRVVQRRPFVQGEEYDQDKGPAVVQLLRKWKRAGLCMRNYKRENVVAGEDGALHIVDIGHDVVEYSDAEFKSMARRAYLAATLRGYSSAELAAACRAPLPYELPAPNFDAFFALLAAPADVPRPLTTGGVAVLHFETANDLEAHCRGRTQQQQQPQWLLLRDGCPAVSTRRAVRRAYRVLRKGECADLGAGGCNDRLEHVAAYEWLVAPRCNDAPLTLVVKCCAQDADLLDALLRQLVGKLEELACFEEVVLLAETHPPNESGVFLRSFLPGGADAAVAWDEQGRRFEERLRAVEHLGLVDRVVRVGFDPERAEATNRRWFAHDTDHTHSQGGEPYETLLSFLDGGTTTDIVLQVDVDIIVNPGCCGEGTCDLNRIAAEVFRGNSAAVTLAGLPIHDPRRRGGAANVGQQDELQAREPQLPHELPAEAAPALAAATLQARYEEDPSEARTGPLRTEIRFAFFHLPRLFALRPLDGGAGLPRGAPLARSWYRLLDCAVVRNEASSLRRHVAGPTPIFMHPPNEMKKNPSLYLAAAHAAASGEPGGAGGPLADAWRAQEGEVDLQGDAATWCGRSEDIVVVVVGYCVAHARARWCLMSLADDLKRSREDPEFKGVSVGVVVADDASPDDENVDRLRCCATELFGPRATFVARARRVGYLENTRLGITEVCTNPASIIVTLDLDDHLLPHPIGVLAHVWRVAFSRGQADVALGGCFRPDKPFGQRYKVAPLFARFSPGAAGNVWTHLRCFRKRLFDRVRPAELDESRESLSTAGSDWAFMVPVTEMAGADRVVLLDNERLYHFEPSSGTNRDAKQHALDVLRAEMHGQRKYPQATTRIPSSFTFGQPLLVKLFPHGLVADTAGVSPVSPESCSAVVFFPLQGLLCEADPICDLLRKSGIDGARVVVVACGADAPSPPPCGCCPRYEEFLLKHGAGIAVRGEVHDLVASASAQEEREWDGLTYTRAAGAAAAGSFPERVPAKEWQMATNGALRASNPDTPVHVRVHSECFTGDILGSMRCDCGEQSRGFLDAARHAPEPHVFLLLHGHEGRGQGLHNKLRAYEAMEHNPSLDHETALAELGCASDARCYAAPVEALARELGAERPLVLHTNNPDKEDAVRRVFLHVEVRPVPQIARADNTTYLREKCESTTLRQVGVLRYGAEELDALVEQLGLRCLEGPTLSNLRRAVRAVLRIPFHNVDARRADHRPLFPVTAAELLRGGLCTRLNTLLYVALAHLGYAVFWALGTTAQCRWGEPDHVFLFVRVEGGLHWVDVGNGRPYYEPLQIPAAEAEAESSVANPLYAAYRVRREGSRRCVVEHRRKGVAEWRDYNYNFKLAPATEHHVQRVHARHVSGAEDAPFAGEKLRVSCWDAEGISLHVVDAKVQFFTPQQGAVKFTEHSAQRLEVARAVCASIERGAAFPADFSSILATQLVPRAGQEAAQDHTWLVRRVGLRQQDDLLEAREPLQLPHELPAEVAPELAAPAGHG